MFHKISKPASRLTSKLFNSVLSVTVLTKFNSSTVAVIDAIITGQFLGKQAVAANGIAGAYFFVVTLVARWFVTGCQNLCAEDLGKGNVDSACNTFSVTICLTTVLTTVIAILGLLFPGRTAILFGAGASSSEILTLTTDYLRGLFPGAPFFGISIILIQMLQMDGDSKRVKLGTWAIVFTDIAGDLLNVLVFHGGMYGMGLATSISQIVQFLILSSHFLILDRTLHFRFAGKRSLTIVRILRTGWPQAVNYTGLLLAPVVLNRYAMNTGGDDAVAALTIMRNAGRILCIYGEAVFGAAMMMGKTSVSEVNKRALHDVEHIVLRHILCGITFVAVIAVLGAPAIVSLYLPEGGVVRSMAITAIQIYAISLPFQALVSVCGAFLLVFGYIALSSVVNIFSSFLFPSVFCMLLGQAEGMIGFWAGFPVAQAVLLLIIFVGLQGDHGVYSKCREMMNNPDVAIKEAEITSVLDIAVFSEDVRRFCIDNGIDEKCAGRLALCLEELGCNVLEHGFDPKKEEHLEIRVIVKNNQITLRIRDDCRPFNFKKLMDEWKQDETVPEKNIGIRIVRGVANDVIYTGTLRTNNLIIRF